MIFFLPNKTSQVWQGGGEGVSGGWDNVPTLGLFLMTSLGVHDRVWYGPVFRVAILKAGYSHTNPYKLYRSDQDAADQEHQGWQAVVELGDKTFCLRIGASRRH
jgi:hypothetical protein